jgi:hypothetical protein
MEKRSLIAYENYRDATQRFEYFLTGLIGALCAYIANSYSPVKINFNRGTLELLSLLVLCLSFYFSIQRQLGIIMISRLSTRKLHLLEKKGGLMEKSGEPIILNIETGDILDSSEVLKEIQNADINIPKLKKIMDDKNKEINRYYKLRFFFLYIGFILLIASKVWSAYK